MSTVVNKLLDCVWPFLGLAFNELWPCETSVMELFIKMVLTVIYFRKKAQSTIFNRILMHPFYWDWKNEPNRPKRFQTNFAASIWIRSSSLHKILCFYLISWCGNFGESPGRIAETLQKLCVFTKILHQNIRWKQENIRSSCIINLCAA